MTINKPSGRFAASTLAATAWVIAFAPERLASWLDRHPHGEELEKETRELINEKVARRARNGAEA